MGGAPLLESLESNHRSSGRLLGKKQQKSPCCILPRGAVHPRHWRWRPALLAPEAWEGHLVQELIDEHEVLSDALLRSEGSGRLAASPPVRLAACPPRRLSASPPGRLAASPPGRCELYPHAPKQP